MSWPTFTVELGNNTAMVPGSWSDITDKMRGDWVTYTYGRSSELASDETGVGRFVLDNEAGTWEPGIDVGTAVRVVASIDSVDYGVFYALVSSAPARWPLNGFDAVVDVGVDDGRSVLARIDIDEVERPRELTGARIDALLDLGGWPAGLRDLDDGTARVDALEGSANVLSAIADAVRAEQGQVYVDPSGVFTFKDRHARLDASTVATFGTSGIPHGGLDPRYDDGRFWNVARLELADGTVVEYDAAPSEMERRVFPVRDLPVDDVQSSAVAAWMVARYGEQTRRFDQIKCVLTSETDDVSFATVVGLRPGDLVRVMSDAVGAGSPVDELLHIERIEMRIGVASWEFTFALSPYFGAGPWLRFDDATVGFDVGGFAP